MSLSPRSVPIKLAASGLGLLSVFIGAELCLRASGFSYPRAEERVLVWNELRDPELARGEGLYVLDPTCLWSLRPGAPLPWTDGELVNEEGFRGPPLERERTSGTLRIATAGGATVLGVGLPWEESFSARLVRELEQLGRPAEVLCAGAEEHSLVQGLALWRGRLRAWRPDVLLCIFTGEAEWQPAVQGRTDSVRLAELRSRAGVPRRAAPWAALALVRCAAWMRDMASGAYWPQREFELSLRRSAPASVGPDWPGLRRVPLEEHAATLAELARECRAEGVRLVLLSLPRRPAPEPLPILDVYQERSAEVAHAEGIAFLRGKDVLRRAVLEDGVPPLELFLEELTLSARGHAYLARALAKTLLASEERPR